MSAKKNAFEQLVGDMGTAERLQMLEKINSVFSAENKAVQSIDDGAMYAELVISDQLEEESIFLKIWLRLKAFFSKLDVEAEYDKMLVKKAAKNLQTNSVDMVNSSRKIFLSGFHEQILNLQKAAQFFKPGIAVYEDNAGAFYVFLGSLSLQEINAEFDESIDPFSLPLERAVTTELRSSLLRKLEGMFADIPQRDKALLYVSVQGLVWLREFTRLPFDRLLSKFVQLPDGTYSCPWDSVQDEVSKIVTVFSNAKRLSPDVIEALFMFYTRNAEFDDQNTENPSAVLDKYLHSSISAISRIREFQLSISIGDLGTVMNNSASWRAEKIPGGEDWFVKFKKQWRAIFDKKWKEWQRAKKRNITKQKIVDMFHVDEYPEIPNRPWESIWGGIECHCAHTLGFLYNWFTILYPMFNDALKCVMVDADFIKREQQTKFTETFNDLNLEQERALAFNIKLSEEGVWGESFHVIGSESIRTLQSQAKINSLMVGIEAEVNSIVSDFGKSCRTMIDIVHGILHGDSNTKHSIISNLDSIQTNEGGVLLRLALNDLIMNFSMAYDVLQDIETMEIEERK